MSCRSRIAVLNEKLTTLERRIEYLEACVSYLQFKYIELSTLQCLSRQSYQTYVLIINTLQVTKGETLT